MEITVNGEKKEYYGAHRMSDFLAFLGISPRPVVVERNLRSDEMDQEPVADGDAIEIIRFVVGG